MGDVGLFYWKVSIFPLIILFLWVFYLASVSSRTLALLDSRGHPAFQNYHVDVVNEYPHNTDAFTEGLLYAGNETLFESTGLDEQSSVRKVALQTGKVEALHKMVKSDFGEGLTLLGERLYQLTYQKQTGYIYDRNNLDQVKIFTHQMHDGWGLATDGHVFFGSDGTSTLYHIDPQTFKVIMKQTIKYKEHEVYNLNELEYVNGEIWANVWTTDCIARISPEDGVLLGWILLPELRESLKPPVNRLYRPVEFPNGIAWDSGRNRIFVTGKRWPKLFEIKLKESKNLDDGVIKTMCMKQKNSFVKS